MMRFIEIDGERFEFEDCHHCPMYYEDSESGGMGCMHPNGRAVWATYFEYLDDDCDLIKGWFPEGCPARKKEE